METHEFNAITKNLKRFFPSLNNFPDTETKARGIIDWCHKHHCHILLPDNPLCERLRSIPNTPEVLYAFGNIDLLGLWAIAVVGARKASPYGMRSATHFARELANMGVVVVSGLAQGIDGAAHRATLNAGGFTIAVLGHGLDRIYPASHRGLAKEIIAKNGCLLSEYPPGTAPLKYHFPERNRILSGLSKGTLVVEASQKSGSLITAKHALNQGKEVFAIPGHFDDAHFSGNHQLIQEGAKLITNISDLVLEFPEIQEMIERTKPRNTEEVPNILSELFNKVQGAGSIEELFQHSTLTLPELLVELESAKQKGSVLELTPQFFTWIQGAA